jgi:hypothetical protein
MWNTGPNGQQQELAMTKKVGALVCLLVSILSGCLSIFYWCLLFLFMTLSPDAIAESTWDVVLVLAILFVFPASSILSFVAARRLWRSDKK